MMRWFPLLWLASCGIPDAKPCDDPHLWYAPDSSGDVYWGCEPPAGWLDGPPPLVDSGLPTPTPTTTQVTADTATPSPPEPVDTDGPVDTSRPAVVETGWLDTALSLDTGPVDTGTFDTSETGGLDTSETGWYGTGHTGDTGVYDSAETGVFFETADTGLP